MSVQSRNSFVYQPYSFATPAAPRSTLASRMAAMLTLWRGRIEARRYLAELDALRQPANHATPVFAAHGEFDNVVPLALGQQAVEALRQRQQPISWRTYQIGRAHV